MKAREAFGMAASAGAILLGTFGLVEYMRAREAQRQKVSPGPLPGDAGKSTR